MNDAHELIQRFDALRDRLENAKRASMRPHNHSVWLRWDTWSTWSTWDTWTTWTTWTTWSNR